MSNPSIALFALGASRDLGARIANCLGVCLAPHEEREFEDGEHKARTLDSVRGRDVYVVQSLYGEPAQSPNDKLIRLLFFLGSLRDAGARHLTAVIPYLCYARKDAKTQPRDPVATRYVGQLFESIDLNRAVVLDVHNLPAFQNAFRIATEHIPTTSLFADHLARTLRGEANVTVVSPDPGGFKRADRLREALTRRLGHDVRLAFMEKARAKGRLSTGRLVGDVAGGTAVIIDDIIASGSTLAAAAEACRAQGSTRVIAAASHALFLEPANQLFASDAIARIMVTDSVPPFRLDPQLVRAKLDVVSIAPLLAEVIARLHSDGSLVDLLDA